MIERAYYSDSIPAFLATSQSQILGELATRHQFALDILQRNAWIEEIANLQTYLHNLGHGHIFLEFAIPRMGKRVDILLLIEGVVFVLEYKAGAKKHDGHAIDQVVDYALDLKNFHAGSHKKYVVPILLSTNASAQTSKVKYADDLVAAPLLSNGHDLEAILSQALSILPAQTKIEPNDWAIRGYKPTPTIVEAAQALYQGHSVEEISRSDAGATNLTRTSQCILEIIDLSKRSKTKSICFVTGVPGAGKTLAGLNVSTRKIPGEIDDHAVFLSGNGPLVNVLREALARDDVEHAREQNEVLPKKVAAGKVNAFIQNIHHFRDEGLRSESPPVEHVVVFDEAQRAWNQGHAAKFMMQKRGISDFAMSEPEFLIGLMDRRQDWCTVICLVGGGQEINTGEAGLVEWFSALKKRFQHWNVYYSAQIAHKDYSWNQNIKVELAPLHATMKEELHLAVSIRSYRAETLSDFVGAVIDGDTKAARHLYTAIKGDYPVAITRDLGHAREWVKNRARGSERYGLVASSGAMRLKPDGIGVKGGIEPIAWFLNDKHDVRSSYYLEDAATEFDIQGLELDWTCVCWDADFRREHDEWTLHSFRGTTWQRVGDYHRRIYLANAYRVLLTRARQGMVIFVPCGDARDPTRPPAFYDGTWGFLQSCGLNEI